RVLTTAGMPYSRATIAPWESSPPRSITTAPATVNSGVQPGSVNGATSTSPGSIAVPASAVSATLARPVTTPAQAAMPRRRPTPPAPFPEGKGATGRGARVVAVTLSLAPLPDSRLSPGYAVTAPTHP